MRKIKMKVFYDIYIQKSLIFMSLIKCLVLLNECSIVLIAFVCTYPSTGAMRTDFCNFYFQLKKVFGADVYWVYWLGCKNEMIV